MSETSVYGLNGGGPLIVSTDREDPGVVHVGWPTGGMWLDRRRCHALIAALQAANDESEGE